MTIEDPFGRPPRATSGSPAAARPPAGRGPSARPGGARPKSRRRRRGLAAYALLGSLLASLGLGAGALAGLMLHPRPEDPRAPPAPSIPFSTESIRPAPPPASPEAPWIRNAAPFGPDSRPRLAVILVDMGRDPSLSAAALRLPGPLNLALAAHLENLKDRASGVRRNGHEALVALPFDRDPAGALTGGALMANLPVEENLRRLRWRIGQAPEAVGVLGVGGDSATRDLKLMEAVMAEIRNAGALFVDARAHPESLAGAAARRLGTPAGDVALRIDETRDLETMVARLKEAEGRASVWGTAVAMAELSAESLEAVRRWREGRGPEEAAPVALAPISAVVKLLRSAPPEGGSGAALGMARPSASAAGERGRP